MNWKERPEIIGENNISDGVEIAGNNVTSKYGYYGKAAAWDVGDGSYERWSRARVNEQFNKLG